MVSAGRAGLNPKSDGSFSVKTQREPLQVQLVFAECLARQAKSAMPTGK